jgi:hypothetical protein
MNAIVFSQDIERWNENNILERANFIVQKFLEIWSAFE